MADLSGTDGVPTWNDEAKAAFSDFRKVKRSLPSPHESNQTNDSTKKYRRIDTRNVRLNSQIVNRKNLFDLNRRSSDLNISNDENAIKNSTFADRHMSIDQIDCESDFDRTEVLCDEIEKNVALTREMIKNKSDAYDILDKLTSDFADFYKKTREMFQKISSENSVRINRMNSQIVSLENNFFEKINKVCEQNDDRLNAFELSDKCSKESCFLWISFTDPAEIENLRLMNKIELIRETKNIFSRMAIWLNSINRQILDVVIQKVAIKKGKDYENENVLGVKFINNLTVQELSRLVMDFAKKQYITKNYDAIRYTVRSNWSPMIWRILRVCYDLASFNLIDKAYVGESGIIAYYTTSKTLENNVLKNISAKFTIRNEKDLNELRQKIGDVGCEFPSFTMYDGNYFKLSPTERKIYKDNLNRSKSSDKPDLSNSASADVNVGEKSDKTE